MIRREKVHKLVVATLEVTGEKSAAQLYGVLSTSSPRLMREEKVRGFKSFVKIINMFPEIEYKGNGTKIYALRKDYGAPR
jgi:hypothetical protein